MRNHLIDAAMLLSQMAIEKRDNTAYRQVINRIRRLVEREMTETEYSLYWERWQAMNPGHDNSLLGG